MTILAARRFHIALLKDAQLRSRLAVANSATARVALIREQGESFSPEEFEEAHLGLLAETQHSELAEEIRLIRLFWALACRPEPEAEARTGSA